MHLILVFIIQSPNPIRLFLSPLKDFGFLQVLKSKGTNDPYQWPLPCQTLLVDRSFEFRDVLLPDQLPYQG